MIERAALGLLFFALMIIGRVRRLFAGPFLDFRFREARAASYWQPKRPRERDHYKEQS